MRTCSGGAWSAKTDPRPAAASAAARPSLCFSGGPAYGPENARLRTHESAQSQACSSSAIGDRGHARRYAANASDHDRRCALTSSARGA